MSIERVPGWLNDFAFDRLDRVPFTFQNLDLENDKSWADRMATAITEEFAVRKRATDRRDLTTPLKWLKPICYNAILTCLHFEAFEALEARIERFGRNKRGPKGERSIFLDGIMGIFAHDVPTGQRQKEGPSPLTDEKSRRRMADQMWWGFRHYAEPAELVAFNGKFPLHRESPPLADDHLDDVLFDQIVERRLAFGDFGSEIEEYRGRYPADIEEEVDKRRLAAEKRRRTMPQQQDEDWG